MLFFILYIIFTLLVVAHLTQVLLSKPDEWMLLQLFPDISLYHAQRGGVLAALGCALPVLFGAFFFGLLLIALISIFHLKTKNRVPLAP